jgi:hypothetical protein
MRELFGVPCSEKFRLSQEYREATELYAATVSEFDSRLGNARLEDYSKLNWMVDSARRQSEDARDRLARHIAKHHC